ncbi:hypothetical protein JKF63_01849 [Porcisia hertigi]|uniref:Cyclic nucleotide-binding domain-containing protein n=1 Tax=Porcisia hertigi TaxID=2761500 RepID=A0A836L0G8_9TRYP|nr:hypothetical protein JKF63_01849 [Porcisia hertigi]
MSTFDKYVAQLVSDMGEVVSIRLRRKILESISTSIDDYAHLCELVAQKGCADAEATKKRKPAVPKSKKKIRRRADLAPVLPTMPSTSTSAATTNNVSRGRRVRNARPSGGGVGGNRGMRGPSSTSPQRTSARPAVSAPTRASAGVTGYIAHIKGIDFGFAKVVKELILDLENGRAHTGSSMMGWRLPLGATSSATPIEAGVRFFDHTPPPVAGMTERLPPPALDHAAIGKSMPDDSGIGDTGKSLSLVLSNSSCFQENLEHFKFGRQRVDPQSSSTSSKDTEASKQVKAFIDDVEDQRRRSIQMKRPSRSGISDSSFDIDEARIANFPATPKSKEKMMTISRVLVRHFLFSALDDSDIAKFASIMDIEEFEAGTTILQKGNTNDTFFIVLDGEAETTAVNGNGVEVVVPLVRGSTLGDLGLMYQVANTVSVVARTWVQCASLERRTYKMITSRAMEEKHTKYIDFLSSLPLFAELSHHEVGCVAECLKEDFYVEGRKLITAGVPSHWLHIIIEGTLSVMAHDVESGDVKEVALLRRGDCAGHIEFIYHHLPVADVVVVSAVVKTAKLSRRSFDLMPSKARERLITCVQEDETYTAYRQRMRSASSPQPDRTPPFDAPPAHLLDALGAHESS